MDYMLQREMDSTVDYAIPLVKPKKGFFHKSIKIIKITKKTIKKRTKKRIVRILKRNNWKYFSRLEIPVQIMSILAFGTLLGAAYAVTMKNADHGDKHSASIADFPRQEAPFVSVFQKKELPKNTSSSAILSIVNSDVVFSLNSFIDQQEKTRDSVDLVTSENIPSDDTITIKPEIVEPVLSAYDQKKIKDLERQILLVQQKSAVFDLSDLGLKKKLDLLIVKNRELSSSLYRIDNLISTIENQPLE